MNRHNSRGFTIVELLIVIVVIAILAAITIVSYNGLQTRAKNTAQKDAVTKFVKLFALYKGANGSYPTETGCLGENNVDTTGDGIGDCNDNGTTQFNSALNAKLKAFGSIPNVVTEQITGTDGTKRFGIWYEGIGLYYFVRGTTADCLHASGANGASGASVWCWEPLP